MRNSLQLNLPPVPVQSLDCGRSSAVHSVDRQGDWDAIPGRALGKAGLAFKVAAAEIGCDQSLLSARLAGKKHLPWSHLGKLGAHFAAELIELVIEFYQLPIGNMSEQDREDLVLGRTIRESIERRLAR